MDKRGRFARFIVGVIIAHTLLICTSFYEQNVISMTIFFVQGARSARSGFDAVTMRSLPPHTAPMICFLCTRSREQRQSR